MTEQAREGVETAREARTRVLTLFKRYHTDRGDTPFNQNASRLLSSVLSKVSDNPRAAFSSLRWERNEEGMVTTGLPFVRPEGNAYTWAPATPAELITTLEAFSKGVLPEPRVQQAGSTGQSPMFEYDDTFSKTENDPGKTPPSPEELADVLFYAHTLSELYHIRFTVQRKMYEYDWFIKNARVALAGLNTFLKELDPAQRNAYMGATVDLIGHMSFIKMAFLPDAVRAALISPGTDGAIWESALKFSINPAAVRWQRNELTGPDAKGGFFAREFAQKAERIGFESHLRGDKNDVAAVQDWLVDTYGFTGIDVPDSMAEAKDNPEVRDKALMLLSFVARALKEAQYDVVEEGEPPHQTRVRKEVYTVADVRSVVEGGFISLGVGDDRDGVAAYARETKDGLCIYAHEQLDSLWIVQNLQGLIKKKKRPPSERGE